MIYACRYLINNFILSCSSDYKLENTIEMLVISPLRRLSNEAISNSKLSTDNSLDHRRVSTDSIDSRRLRWDRLLLKNKLGIDKKENEYLTY